MDANIPGGFQLDSAPAEPAQMPEGFQLDQPTQANSGLPSGFQLNDDKYGTPKQQAIAGLEGVARGVAGPLAPLAEKHILGIPEQDILGREKTNPVTSGVGQGVGLLGGMLTGTGEAAVMAKAGELATEAVGLAKPISYAAKIGSSAVQQAAEMAVLESGDQSAHMILNDPNTSAESAISNIGLASALGGAGGAFITGAVSPLWKATIGDRTEALLNSMRKGYGVEGEALVPAMELGAKAGVEVPSEFQAVIDYQPGARSIHSNLSQNDGMVGTKYQNKLTGFYDKLANKVGEVLGKTPEEIENIEPVDKYTTGGKMADSLSKEIKTRYEPIENAYETVTDKFKSLPITEQDKQQIVDRIAQKSLEEGWHKAESGVSSKLADDVSKTLSKQENIADLKLFMSNLSKDHPFTSPTYRSAKTIGNIIRDTQENIISSKLGPEELKAYQALRGSYKNMMNSVEDLNSHLHLGKVGGVKSFLGALDELASTSGENVLNRLAGKNKAGVLEVLKQYPETLDLIKNYHIDNLLAEASAKARPGTNLSATNLTSKLDKLSPQVRDLIADPAKQEQLKAIDQLVERLRDPNHNYSNTARTVNNLLSDAPTALSVIAGMFGHGGIGALTYLTKLGYSEGVPAMKYGMLKFLSSAQPVKAEGFKSMVQFMSNTMKGQNKIVKASEALFKGGALVLAASQMPNTGDRTKLNKIVTKFEENPEMLLKIANGNTGHYLPQHQTALTENVTKNLQYLQGIKPKPYRASPLDKEIDPSPEQMSRYNRALDVANNPLVVLQHAKDGTIQLSDLQDLKSMYPALYSNISQQVSNQMINRHADEEPIPYKTRMGISLLLGQPVDTSMQPASILAAQPKPKAPTPAMGEKQGKGSKSAIGKSTKSYQTPEQASESRRITHD